jgi:Glycosyl hydrolase family 26
LDQPGALTFASMRRDVSVRHDVEHAQRYRSTEIPHSGSDVGPNVHRPCCRRESRTNTVLLTPNEATADRIIGAGSTRIALVIAIILTLLAVSSCDKSERPVRIFGLSSQGPNFGVDEAEQTARALERKLDVVNIFVAWEWERPLPTQTLRHIHELGALPAITWEPWHPEYGADQPRYALECITAGDFDGYINQWATAAASFGQPLQIRFGHEMNGTWYPWSIGLNGNSATDYQKAYRYVHDRFISAGATNVQWVWSIDSAQKRPQGLKNAGDSYPGDQYVDLVAIDGYNGGPTGATWDSPDDLFAGAIDVATSVAPKRPLWIYETGTGDKRGEKAQWITDLFAYLQQTRVTGLLWFNFNKHGEQNWLLDSSPDVAQAAKAALADW